MEHGSPVSLGTDGKRDEHLARLQQAPNDLVACQGDVVVGFTLSIPHQFAPLLLSEVYGDSGQLFT